MTAGGFGVSPKPHPVFGISLLCRYDGRFLKTGVDVMVRRLLSLPRAVYLVLLLVALSSISMLAFAEPAYQHMVMRNHTYAHFTAFLLLALLCQLALPLRWYWHVLLLIGYGVLLEVVQAHLPSRAATWQDLAVDLCAIAAYFLLVWRPVSRLKER